MKRICRMANYLLLSALSMAVFLASSHAQGTGQKTFSSSEDALTAFIQAVRDGNPSELGAILGPGSEQVVASSDSVADKAARESFLKWYDERHSLVPSRKGEFTLEVGKDGWPLPIPLAHTGDNGIGMEKQAKMRFYIDASATMNSRPSMCAKVLSPPSTTMRPPPTTDNPQAPTQPALSANQVNRTGSIGRSKKASPKVLQDR